MGQNTTMIADRQSEAFCSCSGKIIKLNHHFCFFVAPNTNIRKLFPVTHICLLDLLTGTDVSSRIVPSSLSACFRPLLKACYVQLVLILEKSDQRTCLGIIPGIYIYLKDISWIIFLK